MSSDTTLHLQGRTYKHRSWSELSMDSLAYNLVGMGYERVESVEGTGSV